MSNKKALTPKQEKFCREYLVDYNATRAAIRSGYSKRTAHSMGHENLKKPEIKLFINQILSQEYSMIGVTRNRILQEVVSIAFDCEEKSSVKLKALDFLLNDISNNSGEDTQVQKRNAEAILESLKSFKKNSYAAL